MGADSTDSVKLAADLRALAIDAEHEGLPRLAAMLRTEANAVAPDLTNEVRAEVLCPACNHHVYATLRVECGNDPVHHLHTVGMAL